MIDTSILTQETRLSIVYSSPLLPDGRTIIINDRQQ